MSRYKSKTVNFESRSYNLLRISFFAEKGRVSNVKTLVTIKGIGSTMEALQYPSCCNLSFTVLRKSYNPVSMHKHERKKSYFTKLFDFTNY